MKLSAHGGRVGKLCYRVALSKRFHSLSLRLRTTDQAACQGYSDFCHVRSSLSAKDLADGLAAQCRDLGGVLEPNKPLHRCTHHIVRVR